MSHLIDVNLCHNNIQYTTKLTTEEIEEISNDPNKYSALIEKLRTCATVEEQEKENQCSQYTLDESESSTSKASFRWTHEATKLLIDLRLGMEENFNRPICKKTKLWGQIAVKMKELSYNVSWEECHSKYRNLLATYRHNKQKRLRTGESKILWDYFQTFDQVLGTKASSCPTESLLTSSVTETVVSITEDVNKDLETSTASKTNVEESCKKGKKKANVQELSLPTYLFLKNKSSKERWEEQKILKEKEIAAINNLANAIRATKKRRTSEDSSDSY